MYNYKYPRPALTVDALVYVKENSSFSVLLIQRGIEPFKGKWALPGGFVNMDELLETACKRELEEETGLHVGTNGRSLKPYDTIDRDPTTPNHFCGIFSATARKSRSKRKRRCS
jgi:8-oxo-dGTP diphosphatase